MSVSDGRPFCPHCRAPQVRVEVAAAPSGEDLPATDLLIPVAVTPEHSESLREPATDDRRIARSALFKAGLIGILLVMMIPFLGSVLTGILAVWMYRRSGGTPHPSGFGARVGAAAAALAFFIVGATNAFQITILHAQRDSEEAAFKLFEAIGANVSDPQLLTSIHWVFTPPGMVFSIIFGVIVSAVLGALGGAITPSSRPRPRA